ncbi:DUF3244 domain-containing protein [Bacteroides sp. GM023]|uniref:DUF3244 domain-containing protein n=1 Tax=Bacteroides sp. GM023 TaxID=2723058 RepID=UPI00168B8B9D|nr:DUF3244 domain-containing protein [Bacteroides sp. GM023]MBD3588982.1 DUF3244 domain-containing protein [Bacteroides sp. GM023]
MRKLSCTLLLIVISFMAIGATAPTGEKRRVIDLKRWDKQQKEVIFIPMVAILEDSHIEVQFLKRQEHLGTIQIKDKYDNIVYQDVVTCNEQITYIIKLEKFNTGQYKLLYSDASIKLIGEFVIE